MTPEDSLPSSWHSRRRVLSHALSLFEPALLRDALVYVYKFRLASGSAACQDYACILLNGAVENLYKASRPLPGDNTALYSLLRMYVVYSARDELRARLRFSSHFVLASDLVDDQSDSLSHDDILSTLNLNYPAEAPDIEALLDLLSQNDREILALHYIKGLTCSEIALLLDISIDAVYTRLSRARKRLKSHATY